MARWHMCFSKHFQDFSAAPGTSFRDAARDAPDGWIQVADDIRVTDVGQRYARALFELAEEAKATAAVERDLLALKAMAADSKDLRVLLASPSFSAEDKAAGLAGIAAKAKFHAITRKFLGLLSANRRADALVQVIDCFRKISAEQRGVVSAEIVTALPLSAAQAKGVASALSAALGKDPEISTRVDPALLGGIKVRVGSRLFDASLKSKLDSLKFALKRA